MEKLLPAGFAAIAGLNALATLAVAQGPAQGPAQRAAPAPFTTHQLKPNVYWIEGGGGNKTTAAGGKERLDDIAKITPKPVTTVIETHSDGTTSMDWSRFPRASPSSPTRTIRRSRISPSRPAARARFRPGS